MTGGLARRKLRAVRSEATRELVVPPKAVRSELWHSLRGITDPNKGPEVAPETHLGGAGTKSKGSGEPNGDDPQKHARARTPLPPKV